MKKILPTFFVLCFMATSFAQHKVSLGLRAGTNFSNISNSGLDSKFGLYFNGFAQFRVSHFYAFQPEFGYSRQGGQANGLIENDINIDYFTIAFVNNFYLKNSGFHFILYPSLDFDLENSNFNNSADSNGVTFIDFGLAAGFGYEFASGLVIEARFKHGLIDTDITLFNNTDADQYNVVFQFGVSYKFKIK